LKKRDSEGAEYYLRSELRTMTEKFDSLKKLLDLLLKKSSETLTEEDWTFIRDIRKIESSDSEVYLLTGDIFTKASLH
jgi:hypothetical protein